MMPNWRTAGSFKEKSPATFLFPALLSPWHGTVQCEKSIVPAVNMMCLCTFLKALPSW
jgi:hypothetical protein